MGPSTRSAHGSPTWRSAFVTTDIICSLIVMAASAPRANRYLRSEPGDGESRRRRSPGLTSLGRSPVLWVTAAAFGPYVIQSLGVRLEHIAIYGFGIWGLASILTAGKNAKPPGLVVASVFAGCAVLATVVTVLGPLRLRDPVQALSDLDHYLRPIALSLGVAGWAIHRRVFSVREALRQVCIVIIALLGANTLLSLAGSATDIRAVIEPFRSGRGGDPLQNSNIGLFLDFSKEGRVTGIFAFPFEAGVAYSVGLFAWAYVARTRLGPITMRMYGVLALLAVGGLLSVSKVFIFGGIPLFVLYWIWGGHLIRLISPRFVLVVSAALVALNLSLSDWVGLERFANRFATVTDGSKDFIEVITANRFGVEGSTVGSETLHLLESGDALFGVGVGTPILLDNAYLVFLAQGGIISLMAYLAVLAWLATLSWRLRRYAPNEAQLVFVLTIFVVGAGLGAPVVSTIRASTILWLVLLLAMATLVKAREAQEGQLPTLRASRWSRSP